MTSTRISEVYVLPTHCWMTKRDRPVCVPVTGQGPKVLTVLVGIRSGRRVSHWQTIKVPRQALEAGGYFHSSASIGVGLSEEAARSAVQHGLQARAQAYEEQEQAKREEQRREWEELYRRQAEEARAKQPPDNDFGDWLERQLDRLRGVPAGAREAVQFFGLDTTASIEQLRQEYRRQSLQAHPDSGGSAEQFKELQSKYEQARALLSR